MSFQVLRCHCGEEPDQFRASHCLVVFPCSEDSGTRITRPEAWTVLALRIGCDVGHYSSPRYICLSNSRVFHHSRIRIAAMRDPITNTAIAHHCRSNKPSALMATASTIPAGDCACVLLFSVCGSRAGQTEFYGCKPRSRNTGCPYTRGGYHSGIGYLQPSSTYTPARVLDHS